MYKMNDLKSVKIYGRGVGSKVENFPILFRQEDIDQQRPCVFMYVYVCMYVCMYVCILSSWFRAS